MTDLTSRARPTLTSNARPTLTARARPTLNSRERSGGIADMLIDENSDFLEDESGERLILLLAAQSESAAAKDQR